LREIPQDGTFQQESQFQRLLKKSKGKETFCFDLSAATDTFPIELQQIVAEAIFGKDIGSG
jgi:hypothetical protein